jgi:uncharacterized protein (TIGR01777 family)
MIKKNVLITGGTGFIGKHLTNFLLENNYSVSILTRSSKPNTANIFYYQWDVEQNLIDESAVLNADYIIHLAGEGIADQRWTDQRKKAIVDSREKSIKLIVGVLEKNTKKLEAFVSASGVGIYGAINGEEICDENTQAVDDFLGSTCQKWEAAADIVQGLGIRTVKIRTGLVLGKNDGFLRKLIPIFKYKLGAALGSGQQYMPWIHIEDLCAIYLQAIDNKDMRNAYNAAINDNTNNSIFSKVFAGIYGYKIWSPNVPAIFIQLALGEMALIILKGRRVSSDKIEKTGFQFKYKNLELALRSCL